MLEREPQPGAKEAAIMVLGKNIGEEWTGDRIRRTPGHLSPWSEYGAYGAGIAIEDRDTEAVVFTITNTAGKEPLSAEEAKESGDIPGVLLQSEAVYMGQKFQVDYPYLAGKAFTQSKSWDTNTDAKEARRLIEEGKIDENNWILASIGFHLSRAEMLFRRVGVKVLQSIPTEELIGRRYPELEREIKTSELYKKEQQKEKRVMLVQSLPLAADVISAITKRSRGI